MVGTFLHGALALTCFMIGIVFLKYWVLSRDRFYLWFVAAFWVFSAGWTIKALVVFDDEHTHYVYIPRLIGFTLILIAIIDKNRRGSDAPS